jgi:hypothetical protein
LNVTAQAPHKQGVRDELLSDADLKRRFAWARRQGRPDWLWPDVPIPMWRAALESIAGAVQRLLGDEPASLEGDPEAIGLAGYTSGLGPILGRWIRDGHLDCAPKLAAVLQRHLDHNRIRTTRMAAAAAELVGALAGRGVEAVLLKGAHTGPSYFPEPGVRPASDIDLLIRPSDVGAAEEALGASGLVLKSRRRWESAWRPAWGPEGPRSLSYVHADDPWTVDLHWSLNIALGPGSPVAELDRADPMASRAGVLDQPLLLLHLAAHAGSGWQNLTLLRLLELVLVIRRDASDGRLDWGAFLELGRRTGALGYAYPALRLAEKLAPGTAPEMVVEVCAANAPLAVRRAVDALTPATAQRIDRASLAEHFMWTPDWRGRLRQLASDLVPDVGSWSAFLGIYEERAWRLVRGRVSQ